MEITLLALESLLIILKAKEYCRQKGIEIG